jgi:predicted DCC family thiol-disulfide oxidoreductase YuxK
VELTSLSHYPTGSIIIIYDGDCPFCRSYIALTRLRELSNTCLLNARDEPDLCRELLDKGVSLDEGMLVIMNNELHHGGDAIHRIALLTNKNTKFNKVVYSVFSRPVISRYAYPVLRGLRNITLRLLGKKAIHR